MIEDKAEFLFVSQNALKCIAIEGEPYPVRKQKLILLGEDIADLEEAIRERQFYGGHVGLNNEVTPAINYSVVSLTQYDTRILEVHKSVRDYYTRIKAMIAGGSVSPWMDVDKETALGQPENPVIQCEGVSDPDDYTVRMRHITDDIIPDYNDNREERLTLHSETLENLESAYESAVESENERFNNDPTIAAANEKYETDADGAEEARDDALDRESKLHEQNVDDIERRYEKEDIDSDERSLLLSKEEDRHEQRLQVIGNQYVNAMEAAEVERDAAIAEATEGHYERLAELKEEYDEDVKEENDSCETDLKELRDNLDTEIYTYTNGNPLFAEWLYQQSYSPILNEWTARLEEARIKKSCADKFYERNPLFYYASTPLNRLFADLERMTAFEHGIYPTVYRAAFIYGYGSSNSYIDNRVFDGSESILVEDEDYTATFSNTDFYILYGARYEIDRIDGIYVNVVLRRVETQDVQAEKDAIMDAAHEQVAETMNATNVPWEIHSWQQIPGGYHEEVIADTSGLSPERAEEVQEIADACSRTLMDAINAAARINPRINRTYCVVRKKFEYVETVNEGELSSLDGISDRFADDKGNLVEAREEEYAQAEAVYKNAVERAEATYDTAVDEAAAQRDKDIDAARLACVRNLYGLAPEVNTQVVAAKTQAEKDSILRRFNGEIQEQEFIRQHAIWDAESTYDSAVSDADRTRRQAVIEADNARTTARYEANTRYNTALASLKSHYNDDLIKPIKEAHDARRSAVNQKYNNTVSEAARERDAAIDPAVQSAEDAMKSQFGNPSYQSYDGWWMDYGTINHWTIYTGQGAPGAMRDKADELNQQIWQIQHEEWQKYNETVRTARATQWTELNEIYPLDPLRRGRFVASLEPADSSQYSGDDVTNYVDVVGFNGMEVRYRPRTATGVDFSNYYRELDEEDEENESENPQG